MSQKWTWFFFSFSLRVLSSFVKKAFLQLSSDQNIYDEEQKKVINETVKLEQNYRNFDYESPWEGTKYIKELTEDNDKKN